VFIGIIARKGGGFCAPLFFKWRQSKNYGGYFAQQGLGGNIARWADIARSSLGRRFCP